MKTSSTKDDLWTEKDSELAITEGWCIFETSGVSEPYRLERIDTAEENNPQLDSDATAWKIVRESAANGSDLHIRALAYLKQNSLEEYENIMEAA